MSQQDDRLRLQPMLDQAIRELETMIEKFDGCATQGSPDKDDVIVNDPTCAEQSGLMNVAGDLAIMIEQQLDPVPCEVPPEE